MRSQQKDRNRVAALKPALLTLAVLVFTSVGTHAQQTSAPNHAGSAAAATQTAPLHPPLNGMPPRPPSGAAKAAGVPAAAAPAAPVQHAAPGAMGAQPAPLNGAPPAPPSHMTEPKEPEQSVSPNRPGAEAIKVHGHWKITVHDRDGKFVKEVEFENSLVTPNSADSFLSQMMVGQFAMAGFLIQVEGNLCNYYDQPSVCYLVPGATLTYASLVQESWCYYNYSTPSYTYCYPGLTQSYVPYNATTQAAAYFQLQGSFTALNPGSITSVFTTAVGCETTDYSTVSNATCSQVVSSTDGGVPPWGTPPGTTYQSPNFTHYVLPTALPITAGQVVTVTVTISYS